MMRVLILVLALFAGSVVSASLKDPDDEDRRPNLPLEEIFFEHLRPEDKVWLMTLSIYHEMDIIRPGIPNLSSRSAGKGLEVLGRPGLIPVEPPGVSNELVSILLNGNVPTGWQRRFTRWLRTDFNMTDANFAAFRESGSLCLPGQKNCKDLGDIGSQCCPFG